MDERSFVYLTSHPRAAIIPNMLRLCKFVVGLLDGILDAHQQRRLPLVQLADLVELEQLVGKLLLALSLHRLAQIDKHHVLALRSKLRVHLTVLFQSALHRHRVACSEVADASLEEILLDAVAHKVVVDGRLRNLLVVFDSSVIIAIEGSNVRDLQPELVGQSVAVIGQY